MDSAKNKKSSSDAVFVPSVPGTVSASSGGFRLPDSYWKSLESDPGFRQEWERRLGLAVDKIADETRARVRAEYIEIARKEGFEAGLAEARAAIGGALGELEGVCKAVVAEKQRLLEDHEEAWCRALAHLLRRFLVPGADYAADAVLAWLKESTEEWARSAAIRVLLPKQSETLLSSLVKAAALERSSWTFELDESLAPGEIRCECAGIGISFEPGKELEKIESLIEGAVRGGQSTTGASDTERKAA